MSVESDWKGVKTMFTPTQLDEAVHDCHSQMLAMARAVLDFQERIERLKNIALCPQYCDFETWLKTLARAYVKEQTTPPRGTRTPRND